jgi:ABC-type transport system substrate-binding protein
MRRKSMKRKLQKLVATLVAITMVFAVAPAAFANEEPTYTIRYLLGSNPSNWNPFTWQMDTDNQVRAWMMTQLSSFIMAEDGFNFDVQLEAAQAITDITAEFEDKARWGIPEDATWGYVWRITLEPNQRWCDGTPITAHTHEYSMRQLLNSQQKNSRAGGALNASYTPPGAQAYFLNDQVGLPKWANAVDIAVEATVPCSHCGKDVDGLAAPEGVQLYINPMVGTTFSRSSLNAWYNHNPAYFTDANGNDIGAMFDLTLNEYIEVTDEVTELLNQLIANFYAMDGRVIDSYLEFLHYADGFHTETPWEDVGYWAEDDLNIIWICSAQSTFWDFNWGASMILTNLVHQEVYEASITMVNDLPVSNYGTAVENSPSYGPWKLVNFEMDRQFGFERNPYWFGWTHPKYEGMWQATHVVYDIVEEPETRLMLFNQGNAISVGLTGDQLAEYRFSDRLYQSPTTATWRWIFATSLESLIALEEEAGDGANKRVLNYNDFRRGISLSIDRLTFVQQATAAWVPAFALFNINYYYNISENPHSIYRLSDAGKQAILDLYRITYGPGEWFEDRDEAFAAVTGYDVVAAREAFQRAYEQAVADGNYTPGQEVVLNFMIGPAALTADQHRQHALMNEFVTLGTQGTGFEGMVTINFLTGSTTRYDDVALGRIEAIWGAWQGEFARPHYMIGVYTDPDVVGGLQYIHESNGWDPTTETLAITYDFYGNGEETITRTFTEWTRAMNPGGDFATDMEVRLFILSRVELGVLETFQTIPVGASPSNVLLSRQVEYASQTFNSVIGFGATRQLTFNMSDQEWAAYVAAQGGTLSYE